MLLAIFVILLILGIATFQAVQGLFSSLVMAICTVVVTALAFNFYEPLASLLYDRQPNHADAVALVALFFLPLLLVRILVDRFLPGNVVPGLWVDRIGGGLLGLVTALLIVGTLLIAVQMLPLPRSVVGYDPYDDDLRPASSLGLDAPRFTLAVVKTLSVSGMRGRESFARAHDDLVLELWAARNCREYTEQEEEDRLRESGRWRRTSEKPDRRQVSRSPSWPDALQQVRLYDVGDQPYPRSTKTFAIKAPAYPGDENSMPGNSQVLVVRATIGEKASDGDRWWRLMGTHFRLVAEDGASFYPVGYLSHDGAWTIYEAERGQDEGARAQVGKIEINRQADKAGQLTVDLVYRVPFAPGGEARKMRFLTFRRLAKLPVGQAIKDMPEPHGALGRKEVHGRVELEVPQSWTAKVLFIPEWVEVSDRLPMTVKLPSVETGSVNINKGSIDVQGMRDGVKWEQGTIEGSEREIGRLSGKSGVNSLSEPAGWKVVKLTGRAPTSKPMQTVSGGKLAELFAQPVAIDTQGKKYAPVGAWVRYSKKVGGRSENHLHLYYTDDTEVVKNIAGRQPVWKDVRDTYQDDVSRVTEFGLLFLVPEGATLQRFGMTGKDEVYCRSPLTVGPMGR